MQGFPAWQVLLVDIRCHGESANLPPPPGPHGVESSAQDILKLLSQLKLFPEVLIGHSFGGKVVMSMGEQFGASGKRLPRPVQVKCHGICFQLALIICTSWPQQCSPWRQAFVWSKRLRPTTFCMVSLCIHFSTWDWPTTLCVALLCWRCHNHQHGLWHLKSARALIKDHPQEHILS